MEGDECAKCGGTKKKTFKWTRLNVFDGSASVVCTINPVASESLKDDLMRRMVRVVGVWDDKSKELGYIKHEFLKPPDEEDSSSELKPQPELAEQNNNVEPPPVEEPPDVPAEPQVEGDFDEGVMTVFEGTVKLYGQTTTEAVINHLIDFAGVKDRKEAQKLVDKAVKSGLMKGIKGGKALAWVKK
jgi:hypothetical protein